MAYGVTHINVVDAITYVRHFTWYTRQMVSIMFLRHPTWLW